MTEGCEGREGVLNRIWVSMGIMICQTVMTLPVFSGGRSGMRCSDALKVNLKMTLR